MPEIESSKLDVEDGTMGDLDEGEKFLRDNNITPEYLQELLADDNQIRKLVRKVDMRILPLLAGTFMMQYIDKQALSYAAVFDLFTDTNITQTQYSWFASMFYFAYLVAEYPWTSLAQRTLMGKVVSGCIISWGCVLMLTAACDSFGGLAACRFFLGFFEAPITPCFMMIVGMWVSLQIAGTFGVSNDLSLTYQTSTLGVSTHFEQASSTAATVSDRCSAGSFRTLLDKSAHSLSGKPSSSSVAGSRCFGAW
jgi:hypothetical protein